MTLFTVWQDDQKVGLRPNSNINVCIMLFGLLPPPCLFSPLLCLSLFSYSTSHAARRELKKHFVPSLMSLSPCWASRESHQQQTHLRNWLEDLASYQIAPKGGVVGGENGSLFAVWSCTDVATQYLNAHTPFSPKETFVLHEQLDKITAPVLLCNWNQCACVFHVFVAATQTSGCRQANALKMQGAKNKNHWHHFCHHDSNMLTSVVTSDDRVNDSLETRRWAAVALRVWLHFSAPLNQIHLSVKHMWLTQIHMMRLRKQNSYLALLLCGAICFLVLDHCNDNDAAIKPAGNEVRLVYSQREKKDGWPESSPKKWSQNILIDPWRWAAA